MTSITEYLEKLKGKTVIVTGAARGIGLKLSETLVSNKTRVFLVDKNPAIADHSKRLNDVHGDLTRYQILDLTKTSQISNMFAHATTVFSSIDAVVNNAGIANDEPLFSQESGDELMRIIKINLVAPMEMSRVAVRYFQKENRPGVIVNVASVGGLLPISLMESYGTTKAGLIFFTTTCRSLSPLVRVNAVAPYFADTELLDDNKLVGSYPIIKSMGMMDSNKVVKTILTAMTDESLAGDTLMVSMGNMPAKLTMYDDVTASVVMYISRGTVKKYSSLVYRPFSRFVNFMVGLMKSSPPNSTD